MKKHFRSAIGLFVGVMLLLSFSAFITLYVFGYHPPILMYHHIKPDEAETSKLVVSPFHFERHMNYLKEKNYRVVPLATLFSWILENKPIPTKTLAITFDDGYRNTYTHAFPILKKYGFPATIFLIINSVGLSDYLTWNQINEMERHGIDFGNHTLTHPNLTEIPLKDAKKEIFKAKTILDFRLKSPSRIFCYPVGGYNQTIIELVKKAGYQGALSTSPNGYTPLDERYGFKRIRISNSSDDLSVFWLETSGYYSFISQSRKKLKSAKRKIGEFFQN